MSDFLAVTTYTFQLADGPQKVVDVADQPRKVQFTNVTGALWMAFNDSVIAPIPTVGHRAASVGTPVSTGVSFVLEAGQELWMCTNSSFDNGSFVGILVTRLEQE